ncbi:MAG: signal peptidase II [Clostridia bacterium]|nr:signal peptidase II [Clostridia bacterium]
MTNRQEKEKIKIKGVMKGSCLWGILLFFILLLVDQLTKLAADVYFNLEGAPQSLTVIPNLIYLTISYNRGIAFGVAATSPLPLKIGIIIGTVVMMAGIAVLYFKIDKRRSVVRTALVLVFSGGIGNLIDRVYYRVWDPASYLGGVRDGVRDMVDLNAFGLAVCNFADFFIVIGAIVLLLGFLFFDRDAFFPVGKYKEMAKEQEAKEEAKKAAKKEKEEK